ncbi:YjcZ family sporulation protein [Tuberibacillus calidus]|uniref:YjcZ family sporulation protein n=1 Tax=Tuberibacillus calidus TaxID=340097 RepID=UPI0009D6D8E4|nr:YjcZ family sporulation protein [Tuberibacillus calidus]
MPYYGHWGANAPYGGGYVGGCGCFSHCGYGWYGVNNFALIVVLFILLIIVGTAYVY